MNDKQEKDAASAQLENYKKNSKGKEFIARQSDGIPCKSLTATLTAGPRGPALLQDTELIGLLQNYVRARNRKRIVHAKGTGGHGFFQCTNPEMSKYSKAALFQNMGKKIPVFSRFGFSDKDLEPDHGGRFFWAMSTKFDTEDGIFDMLGINTPMFSFRDAFNFPSEDLSTFPNPANFTEFQDPTVIWDYAVLRPELTHMIIYDFSDRGQPQSVAHTNYFPVNIFKLVREDGDFCYAKFNVHPNAGFRFLTDKNARLYKRRDPEAAIRQLFNDIESKNYPSWTWNMQIMEKDEPRKYQQKTGWSAFDLTKLWPHEMYPNIEIGQIVLNRNPDNHFNEVEKIAFNPGNLVPGIEAPVEDKLFHGRIFAYHDAQMYRVGPNKSTRPINRPKEVDQPFKTYFKGCPMNFDPTNQGGQPIYAPNSFGGPKIDLGKMKSQGQFVENTLEYHDTSNDDNFGQPRIFYEKVMGEDEKRRLASNLATSLEPATLEVQRKVIDLLKQVSPRLGREVAEAIEKIP